MHLSSSGLRRAGCHTTKPFLLQTQEHTVNDDKSGKITGLRDEIGVSAINSSSGGVQTGELITSHEGTYRAWFCSIRFHPLSPGVLGR